MRTDRARRPRGRMPLLSVTAPSFRSVSLGTLLAATAPTPPAGVQAGDLLELFLAVSGAAPAAPVGWTLADSVPGIFTLAYYTRQATGSDAFTLMVGTTGPYHFYATSGGVGQVDAELSAASGTAPSVSTTAANTVLKQAYAGSGSALGVPTGGGVNLAEQVAGGIRLVSSYRSLSASGATGSGTSANAAAAITSASK